LFGTLSGSRDASSPFVLSGFPVVFGVVAGSGGRSGGVGRKSVGDTRGSTFAGFRSGRSAGLRSAGFVVESAAAGAGLSVAGVSCAPARAAHTKRSGRNFMMKAKL